MTIIFLESPEPDTQGFWRKQNSTTRGPVNLREIGDLRGVSLSCGYVLRGSEFYMCICSGYRNKSVTRAALHAVVLCVCSLHLWRERVL